MKKFLQGLIIAALSFAMIGCGGKKEEAASSSSTASASKDKTEEKQSSSSKTESEDKTTSEEKSKDDEDDVLTPKEKKEKEQGFVADKSKFPKGEYYVAASGMHVRKRTNVSSTAVYANFPVGTVLQITSVKTGEADPSTVWGKIKSPVSGWICIADKAHCYLMTPEEWAEENKETTTIEKVDVKTENGEVVETRPANGTAETVDDSDVPAEDKPASTGKNNTVKVKVEIIWEGAALENVDQIGPLDFTLTDNEGPASTVLSAANDWSATFLIAKGVEFYCSLDFSKYSFITQYECKWNVSTGVFTYIVS
ncbi:MAG: hypothetical protein KBT48_11005 [Firmicutes bacterium]|nr:hypothetical protein [Bacillota bacterium]